VSDDNEPRLFTPEAGIGVPLAVAGFGFAVLVLGMASARWFNPAAVGFFVPVAMATGAYCLLIGGLFEFRANNTFGGTFAVLYAGFLLTTGLILRWFSGDISTAAGALAFGDAFGAWLLLWGVFTLMLSWGAYYLNMPALLAFVLLAAAYFVLGFANLMNPGDGATFLTKLGGWLLIADGVCAWYLSWAAAMNSVVAGRLPLWPYPYAKATETTAPPMETPAITA
jgi:succinate-acetate transporter protein